MSRLATSLAAACVALLCLLHPGCLAPPGVDAVPAFAQWTTGHDVTDAVAGTYIDGIGTVVSGSLQGFSSAVPGLFVINNRTLTVSVESNTSAPLQILFPATSSFCQGQDCVFAMDAADGTLYVAYLSLSTTVVQPLRRDMPWRCTAAQPCRHTYLSTACPNTPKAVNANVIVAANGIFLFDANDASVQTVAPSKGTGPIRLFATQEGLSVGCTVVWVQGSEMSKGTLALQPTIGDIVTLPLPMCADAGPQDAAVTAFEPEAPAVFVIIGCGCAGILVDVSAWRIETVFTTLLHNATDPDPRGAVQQVFLRYRLTAPLELAVAVVTDTYAVLATVSAAGALAVVRNVTLCSGQQLPLMIQRRHDGDGAVGLYFVVLCIHSLLAFSFDPSNSTAIFPAEIEETVFGTLFASAVVIPQSPPTANVVVAGVFNHTECVVFVPDTFHAAVAGTLIVNWTYCTQEVVSTAVYDGAQHLLVSSASVGAVIALNTAAAVAASFVQADSPTTTLYAHAANTAFMCYQVNGAVYLEAVTLTLPGIRAPLWRTWLPCDCSSFLEASASDPDVLFVGGYGIATGVTIIAVLSAPTGAILLNFSTSAYTECDYGPNDPGDCPFQTPIYSRTFDAVVVQSSASNCLYVASVRTRRVGALVFAAVDRVEALLHEPGTDLLVLQAANATSPFPNSQFLFGVSLSEACEGLKIENPTLPFHVQNMTGTMRWSSYVPYYNAFTVGFGGLFYVSSVLQPTVTFTNAAFEPQWTTALSNPVVIPTNPPRAAGVLLVEDMVCVFYSAITCCAVDDGTRLFSLGDGYWGLPIVSPYSDFVFVGSEIRSFNYVSYRAWLATSDNVNYNGDCSASTAALRGDVLFVHCNDQQQNLPRLYVLRMADGTFLLGSGPTLAVFDGPVASTLLVAQSSDTILMTVYSNQALLSMQLLTTNTSVALAATEFFCASGRDAFYTFAFNWNDTTLFDGPAVGFAGQATLYNATPDTFLFGGVRTAFAAPPVVVTTTQLLGSSCSNLLPIDDEAAMLAVLVPLLYGTQTAQTPGDFLLFGGSIKVITIGMYTLSSAFCPVAQPAAAPEKCSVFLSTADQYWVKAFPPLIVVDRSAENSTHYVPVQTVKSLVMNSSLLLQVFLDPIGTFPVPCSLTTVTHFITDNFVYCFNAPGYALVLSHYNATSAVTVFSKILFPASGSFTDYSMQIRLPTIYEALQQNATAGELILSPFLLFLALRPDQNVVPSIGAITGGTYANSSITLTVKGIDGEVQNQHFTAGVCQLINSVRCAAVEQFSADAYPADPALRSVTWNPVMGSQWTTGFAWLTHPFPFHDMRSPASPIQQLRACSTHQSTNSSLCSAGCIGNHSQCGSIVQHRLLMYLLAFATYGSDSAFINITTFPDVKDLGFLEYGCMGDPLAAAAESFAQNPVVDVQCGRDEIVVYAPLASNLVVHRSRHGAVDPYLLVQLHCTKCVYFLKRQVSASPFSWNLVGAVKSLLVVLTAYWFTRRFPGAMLSIKQRYAKMVTLLGNFRANDTSGKEQFRASIVKNFSPPELSARGIAQRLQSVLNRHPPREFVEFFEWNLCHDRQWILVEKSSVPADDLGAFSEIAFGLLRVYEAYTPSYDVDSISDGDSDGWVILNNDCDRASEIAFTKEEDAAAAPASTAATRKMSQLEPSSSTSWVRQSPVSSWAHAISSKFVILRAQPPNNSTMVGSTTSRELVAMSRARSHSFDEKQSRAALAMGVSLNERPPPALVAATTRPSSARERAYSSRSSTVDRAVPNDSALNASLLTGQNLSYSSVPLQGQRQSLLDVMDTADLHSNATTPRSKSKDVLDEACQSFVELRDRLPQFFEYALLPSRTLDVRLVPVPVVLVANMLYFVFFVLVCVANEVSGFSAGSDLSWFDSYQVVYFQVLNSTAVGSLLVDAVVRVTLKRRDDFRVKLLLTSPYVCAGLLLIFPALITHCIIGAVLYAWLVVPLVAVPLMANYLIQNSHFLRRNSTITILFILRSAMRVAIIFSVCTALSISFNYAALYFYQSNPSHARGPAMTKFRATYLGTIVDDYEYRSYGCLFEEWTQSLRAVMQHFSALIGVF